MALGVLSVSLAVESVLETPALFANFGGETLRRAIVGDEGGFGRETPDVSFAVLLVVAAGIAGASLAGGAALLARRTEAAFGEALRTWAVAGWRWWWIPGGWELARLLAFGIGWDSAEAFLAATPQFWFAVTVAGWVGTFVVQLGKTAKPASVGSETTRDGYRVPVVLGIAVGLVVLTFTLMNWGLYRNLLVPHGDSAMYEEHLWNVTHGKGFRSYLDRGLFLGEHVQVIHLLLLPVHLVWPSLLPMEFAESLALFSSAIPVFWIARRHGADERSAVLLSLACLLYVPLHSLDVAADLKTFRPIAFGVPLVLIGLDQLERRRIGPMLILFALALSAKEDYAIVLAPIGLWWAWDSWRKSPAETRMWRTVWPGVALAVFATGYLLVVVKWVIPWFRGGVEVHYVGYFSRFGESLNEVVRNLLLNPSLLFEALFVPATFLYAVAILVPLGGMPLRSPSRLLVGLPIFVLLCLNELDPVPRHHFHAPLVPLVFWAAAAGLAGGNASPPRLRFRSSFTLTCALLTGAFVGFSPLSLSFWESGSPWHWRTLYVKSERAEAFEGIAEAIPRTARVFSTDYVHPRFTHHERPYDYSAYPRPSDAELESPLPDEEYWLVIDVGGRYNETLKRPQDVPGFPEKWQLVDELTNEWFLVFRRQGADGGG